jgi:hypothetical protein
VKSPNLLYCVITCSTHIPRPRTPKPAAKVPTVKVQKHLHENPISLLFT